MRLIALAAILAALAVPAAAKPLPPLSVSPNGHYFVTPDGKPFFWLGDTAWELIHAATPDEQTYYLKTRSRQGYTIVQTVVLGEVDGLRKPTPDGLTPFQNDDPSKPNLAYFDRVAEVVERAETHGLYVGLLPTWGDKVTTMWGTGPQIFPPSDPGRAEAYGRFLAGHLKCRSNIVWVLGGDRPPEHDGIDYRPVWAAMAKGIATACGRDPLIAYHPNGGPQGTSYTLADADWLDIHGMQSGHGGGHDVPVWEMIAHDFTLARPKPTLDLEPNYEDHPYNSWPRWDASTGYFDDYDVRKQTYRSVFAGAAGVTYGHHSIWGMVGPRNDVINHAKMDWVSALHRPGGRQMMYLRDLIESRPQLDRIPDDSLIVEGQGSGNLHMTATRDTAGTYAFVYMPLNDRMVTIDLSKLNASLLRVWWYDPRTGFATWVSNMSNSKGALKIKSPPIGPDWILVLDDAAMGYPPPGAKP
ncbi:glycoside hydrolase family 140 protein [Asticcacaulis sp. AC402]|uniref:glycoside hydrolase family 140 protein n=1 Tax=Asticcacaulis sp. AC402 TaxID=1282361 RepID=UPI0003C3D0AA|nr:glycoside hydrolase family 140 protein [Asticcacaulis sp. AC402]ESQ77569.1 hypothetical protein ABAC402_00135 [Asticcacaulis sp. AC402]